MFNLERMKEAVDSPSFRMPVDLSNEQKLFLLDLASKDEKTYRQLECLTDANFKLSIKELMYKKKRWDSEILEVGGVSYYSPTYPEKLLNSEGSPYKAKYRVAKTSRECDKLLKFRVKTADGKIFSVASKTQGEAQYVVDNLFGKGHYRVSQMLY